MSKVTTCEEHKQRHVELHRAFDELLADWIGETESLPSEATVMEFMQWSYTQTKSPSDRRGLYLSPNAETSQPRGQTHE